VAFDSLLTTNFASSPIPLLYMQRESQVWLSQFLVYNDIHNAFIYLFILASNLEKGTQKQHHH
jgi:hypothetical protein